MNLLSLIALNGWRRATKPNHEPAEPAVYPEHAKQRAN